LRILAVAIGAEAFKNIDTFSKNQINRTSDMFVRVCRIQAFGRTKTKGKVRPRTDYEDPEGEWKYSSTLSLTL
jgi:hypothetical protein